jgi:hypothetical protein
MNFDDAEELHDMIRDLEKSLFIADLRASNQTHRLRLIENALHALDSLEPTTTVDGTLASIRSVIDNGPIRIVA